VIARIEPDVVVNRIGVVKQIAAAHVRTKKSRGHQAAAFSRSRSI